MPFIKIGMASTNTRAGSVERGDSDPTASKTTSPGARRRKANLDRILDTAAKLIAADGVRSMSMSRLADAADYTPGALYRYFASKDALLAALVARVIGEVAERIDENRHRYEEPVHRILAAVWSYRRFASEQPHGFALIANLLAAPDRQIPDDDAIQPVVHAMTDALRPLAEELHAARHAGVLAPGDMVERSLVMFAMIQGALQLHKQERIATRLIEIDRIALAGLRTLFIGWGADPDVVDTAIDDIQQYGAIQ